MNRTELAKRIKDTEGQASSGHYLTRIIAICQATDYPDLVDVLQAYKRFLDKHFKPDGVDDFIHFASRCALYSMQQAGLTPEEIKPVVWGLDWQVLKDAELLYLRSKGGCEARENV